MSNDFLKNFLELPRENLSVSEQELLAGLEEAFSYGDKYAKEVVWDLGFTEEEARSGLVIGGAEEALLRWLSAKDMLTDSEKELAKNYYDALQQDKYNVDLDGEDEVFDELDEEGGIENEVNFAAVSQETTHHILPQTRDRAVEQFLEVEEGKLQGIRLIEQMERHGLKEPMSPEDAERIRKLLQEARSDFGPKPN